MKNNCSKKVSIILIHYNQQKYIKEALKSVFIQKYKNIELIIADDASKDLDINSLKEFIKKENKNKIKVEYQINKKNIGTVKNINNALKKCEGEYILIFGADDKLYDKNVISNYIDLFNKQPENVAIVFSQCYMMDKKLEKTIEKYIDINEAQKFNLMTAKEQLNVLAKTCFAAMGACMLNNRILDKLNGFDQRFKYIEDWTYFLTITDNNYRMIYGDFGGLLHRDGGISHNKKITKLKADFLNEIIKINEIIVFPSFGKLKYKTKKEIIKNYLTQKDNLKALNILYKSDFNYKRFKYKNILFYIRKRLDKRS